MVGEVTTLAHEVGDHTVETRSLEAETLLASAQRAEVLGGLGNNISLQFHDNAAKGLVTGGDVEEAHRVGHCEKLHTDVGWRTGLQDRSGIRTAEQHIHRRYCRVAASCSVSNEL